MQSGSPTAARLPSVEPSMPAATATPSVPSAAVFERLRPHMAELDSFLRAQLAAFEPEIRALAEYCLDTSGKRLRPALVFLAGWGGEAPPAPPLVRAAAIVELVHLATLVHDDIMDAAELRRGRDTAARRHGPDAAVLLGDALFAHALHLAAQFPTTEVCLAVADSTRKVCAGEIMQTLRRRATDVTRADYDRVIELKTAELFRVSCTLGAGLGGFSPEFARAAAEFGRRLGVAYQIYDDLTDFFGDENRVGKTLGTDLRGGKLTLPLFTLRDRLPADDRAALLDEIAGRRAPDAAARRRQMRGLGVFAAVEAELEAELAAAEGALAPHAALPPAPMLRRLAELLRAQVAALRPE
jgi:octaprenyl-diphosphate synthase